MQDAVLRMLVDKYKPLRSGKGASGIESAEEKMKRSGGVPRVRQVVVVGGGGGGRYVGVGEGAGRLIKTMPVRQGPDGTGPVMQPTKTGSWADEPLLPSSEDYKPWNVTFKAPSDDESGVGGVRIGLREMNGEYLGSGIGSMGMGMGKNRRDKLVESGVKDDKARRLEREERKRSEQAGRLTRARDSTLDYRLGICEGKTGMGSAGSESTASIPNPVSMKGWTSLVEDRIEKARSTGAFKVVQGRGEPMVRSTEEFNPFIAREEFLMNRIVQKNGVAPPWVEIQGELDSAIRTFRELVRQSWIRRALRVITTDTPTGLLHTITLERIKSVRDEEWVKKERSYHETALGEVNGLVRNYNGLAPYPVRRPYYVLNVELERMYEEAAEEIMKRLEARGKEDRLVWNDGYSGESKDEGVVGEPDNMRRYGFSEFVRDLLRQLSVSLGMRARRQ
ncbi:hypothetical protein AMATHDRAFT_61666 [Amanita thiersii Skay4041]|uniref:DnaJ homologue subfamily C member 28 conserved domain-containing protein n=1 Tax=Amanita thiersii Skay4041 TaxID=703135 RepID=A0A2A9NR59_9AGAR|nr:hypothetical protein AMATHDRAFT_61666 [Amanita thiersii Skay4041]